ncbi:MULTISPECIES: class F sortase [Carnobacterium]|uniref:class F sortase n=1 Tax=Carnobacterium TaxID=2747 RepID=UPI00288EB93A|nr:MULTISPECIES: class F sortase [Carnobacterium]MDT1939483.1 class F sortase [Carnobacterium divergens]MDT1941921.1 class F sortase [Carnobacterium divergens]MDT1947719.1 class F sortase [Carnobacterium divergens]MDT1950207.1 class F sortase [Carnobacterium divergens]MDT1955385.1 class F sortase [Carnobacterium divergens]
MKKIILVGIVIIGLSFGYYSLKTTNSLRANFKEEVTTKKVVGEEKEEVIDSIPNKIIFIEEGIGLPINETEIDSHERMIVPEGLKMAGWLKTSPIPGNVGNSLIAAHRDWNNKLGAFKYLEDIKIGETVVIEYKNGENREFKVRSKEIIDIKTNPNAKIEINSNKRMITLISCTGAFDTKIKSYTQRALVTLE